ncbi:hypothetical protein MNBD_UNCLBAC01-1656 [hydrothermal vent metagenome]|uniref:UTP-monosaccharide-1-phosphate uridylyltransferase n=1 Tax=hydrothermal vent metagenome TaxID=652676 RepID=A0A3B1DRI3_9ZZZZ
MNTFIEHKRRSFIYRILSAFMAFTFIFTTALPPQSSFAQSTPQTILDLPFPGAMVPQTAGFTPTLIKGITIHPDNPLMFDFIIDNGDETLSTEELKTISKKLVKYFLASLTVPEEELWVNLSPYEEERVIPEGFGDTEMGRDLLAQDYMLKQLTSSLMYPEDELGQEFWKRVYEKAYEMYGTTKIPVNTFNKVWIVPESAQVYEHENSAFVVGSKLKVMLEEDYLALQENMGSETFGLDQLDQSDAEVVSSVSSNIVREILIPAIEKEVNEGKTFANLRQISNSMILAAWYKQNLRNSLLGHVYMDQNKTAGVDTEDKQINQKIYDQYVEAFNKGVYNYIREDYDNETKQIIPRKYFSGGLLMAGYFALGLLTTTSDVSYANVPEMFSPDSSVSIVQILNVEETGTNGVALDTAIVEAEYSVTIQQPAAQGGYVQGAEALGSDQGKVASSALITTKEDIENILKTPVNIIIDGKAHQFEKGLAENYQVLEGSFNKSVVAGTEYVIFDIEAKNDGILSEKVMDAFAKMLKEGFSGYEVSHVLNLDSFRVEYFFLERTMGTRESMMAASSAIKLTDEEKQQLPQVVLDNIEGGVIIAPQHIQALKFLIEIGEARLLKVWQSPGIKDGYKRAFLEQLLEDLDPKYVFSGGLKTYKENMKKLLEEAGRGKNPLEGLVPEKASGVDLTEIQNNPFFYEMEGAGFDNADKLGVFIVAGGMGERLGFSGTKLGIPLDLVTEKSYLQHYIESILAIQNKFNKKYNKNIEIPLMIMVSEDTMDETISLLKDNNLFGMNGYEFVDTFQGQKPSGKSQIILLRQRQVPSIGDMDAGFVLEKNDRYTLQTKPYGHGDVNKLAQESGIIEIWKKQGKEYTVSIQDTNGQVFNGILPALGVSVSEDLDLNFLAVPREAGEATGSIVMNRRESDGRTFVMNVEYNQLDPLLKATGHPEGDVADPITGKSPYPANLNVLIYKNETFIRSLNEHDGLYGEFVNPKWTDESKALMKQFGEQVDVTKLEFKKPTRGETMLQDIAIGLPEEAKVKYTMFTKRDVFSPVKNSIEEAKGKVEQDLYADAMVTGEQDFYKSFRKRLHLLLGVQVKMEGNSKNAQGIPYGKGAKLTFSPNFAITIQEFESRFDLSKDEVSRITDKSIMHIDGENIKFEGYLRVDGTVMIVTAPDVNLIVKDLAVTNIGRKFVDLTSEEMSSGKFPEYITMRGYHVVKQADDELNIRIDTPGDYVLTGNGELYRIVTQEGGSDVQVRVNTEIASSALSMEYYKAIEYLKQKDVDVKIVDAEISVGINAVEFDNNPVAVIALDKGKGLVFYDQKETVVGFGDIIFLDEKNVKINVKFTEIRQEGEGVEVFVDRVLKKYSLASSTIANSLGGINLDPKLLDLQIKRDGNGVPLPIWDQPIEHMNIQGFVPVIINIQHIPFSQVPMLLGLADEEELPVNAANDEGPLEAIPDAAWLPMDRLEKFIKV